MARKISMVHPNFIVGLVSYLLLLTGVVLISSHFETGITVIIGSVLLGFVHWVRSIIDVWTDPELKNEETKRYFWFGLVIMIPPLVGMMYYIVNKKRVSF